MGPEHYDAVIFSAHGAASGSCDSFRTLLEKAAKKFSGAEIHLACNALHSPDPFEPLETVLNSCANSAYSAIALVPLYVTAARGYRESVKRGQNIAHRVEKLVVGNPLLFDHERCGVVARVLVQNEESGPILYMGHGSHQGDNSAYQMLREMLHQYGHELFVMEGEPSIEAVMADMRQKGVTSVNLKPLLIARGNHVVKDMAGDSNSYKTFLEEQGFSVAVDDRVLLENDAIIDLFLDFG